MSAVQDLPRFRSASDLLSFAFAMQAKKVYPKGSGELASKGTNPAELTPHERIAEGMMYYHAAMTALRGRKGLQRAVKAWYTVPADSDLKRIKAENAYWLAILLMSGRKAVTDRWCAYDLIAGWAHQDKGFRNPKHSYDWWANHLGINRNTIYYWATSKRGSKEGMVPAAERYLNDAEKIIADELEYRGIL